MEFIRKDLGKKVLQEHSIRTKPRTKSQSHGTQQRPFQSFRARLRKLAEQAQLMDDISVEISMTRTIYYKTVIEQLSPEVVMDVVNQRWISATVINIWIKYVWFLTLHYN